MSARPPAGAVPRHAFVSYAREDAGVVDRLTAGLQARGVAVWRDLDRICPGDLWKGELRVAIRDAGVFVACFSSTGLAKESAYQNEELVQAVEQWRLRRWGYGWILPVTLDGCAVPDIDLGAGRSLRDLHVVDLAQDWDGGLDLLARSARRHRADATGQPDAADLVSTAEECARALRAGDVFPGSSDALIEPGTRLLSLSRRLDRYVDAVGGLCRELATVASDVSVPPTRVVDCLGVLRDGCDAWPHDGDTVAALRRTPLTLGVFCVALGSVRVGQWVHLAALADRRGPVDLSGSRTWLLEGVCPSWGLAGRAEIANLTLDRWARMAGGHDDALLSPLDNRRLGPWSAFVREALRRVLPAELVGPDQEFVRRYAEAEGVLSLLAEDLAAWCAAEATGWPAAWPPDFLVGCDSVAAGYAARASAVGPEWPPLSAGCFGGSARRAVDAANSLLGRVARGH